MFEKSRNNLGYVTEADFSDLIGLVNTSAVTIELSLQRHSEIELLKGDRLDRNQVADCSHHSDTSCNLFELGKFSTQ
jgi:hypothetical protein